MPERKRKGASCEHERRTVYLLGLKAKVHRRHVKAKHQISSGREKSLGSALRRFPIFLLVVDPCRAAPRITLAKVIHISIGLIVDLVNGLHLDSRIRLGENLLQFL